MHQVKVTVVMNNLKFDYVEEENRPFPKSNAKHCNFCLRETSHYNGGLMHKVPGSISACITRQVLYQKTESQMDF